MSRREFQLVEGASSKFWAIERNGSSFTLTWGRIGTTGQTQTKEFASDAEAGKQYEKLVAEKVKKGYGEVGGGATGAAAVKTAAAKPAAPAIQASAKSPAAKPAAKETAPAAAPPTSLPPAAAVNADITRHLDLEPADW